jgi:hypothetical protein
MYKLTVKSDVSNKKKKFEKTCNTLMYYICLINRSLVMKNIIPVLALLFCLRHITSQDRTINPDYHFIGVTADALSSWYG